MVGRHLWETCPGGKHLHPAALQLLPPTKVTLPIVLVTRRLKGAPTFPLLKNCQYEDEVCGVLRCEKEHTKARGGIEIADLFQNDTQVDHRSIYILLPFDRI